MKTKTSRLRRASTAYGTLSEERLRAFLDADCRAGGVVTGLNNQISRKHYAGLFGCTSGALTRFKAVFAEYERELGVVTGPKRHLPEMLNWINTAYEAGELDFRGGKLDRSAFRKHFNLKNEMFTASCPAIRSLFERLDDKARCEGYLSSVRKEELARVRQALAVKPSLNKDRLTINITELAKVARVPKHRLRDDVFADALSDRQAELMVEVQASRLDPYFHGRVFPFSQLTPLWPISFLKRVGDCFKQRASCLASSSVKHPYLKLVDALDWIGTSNNPYCRAVVKDTKKNGKVLSAGDWEDALFAYRDHLLAGATKDRSVDIAIRGLRRSLAILSSGRVVPDTAMPLPGIKNAGRQQGHLRSVAEAVAKNAEGADSEYIVFARERYFDVCKNLGIDFAASESHDFLDSLAAELHYSGNPPGDPASTICDILERRLDAIRSGASAIIAEAVAKHQAGRILLAQANIDGAEFEREFHGFASEPNKRDQLVARNFPNKDSGHEQVRQGTANLLSLLDQQYGGIPPSCKTALGSCKQFFNKRYLAYGGLKTIEPMLYPESSAVGAALTLYLVESGANISVGRTLNHDCLKTSDLHGYCRITGHKARAQGKPIIVDLPKDSPAVHAIEWLLSAGAPLQVNAKTDDDRLFLLRIGGRVKLMTPHWYTRWFKQFAASIPGLEEVSLLPNMIRPSVLLHANLNNDGRLATGMAIGQHSIAVTQGYQQKWPTRHLYDQNIRRFQTALETLVVSSIDGAAEKLGITVEQFEARLGNLRATGLGTFCRNKAGRPEETSGTCSTLDCWNDCPNLLIVAETEDIAALQLWQKSLHTARPEWERDRPERWDQVWLPWLCLTDVVEEKMVRGPLLKVWNAAKQYAIELSNQPGYVPPKPW